MSGAKDTPGTFFSYSRDDAEFVLRITKDLRAAGINVWLDQLDIVPGQPWDRAVEEALEGCQRLLVGLSRSSVESSNVMDEVSYALDEKKTVIPVILKECRIPFRLRRLQYVDFRAGYEKGLTELAGALGKKIKRNGNGPPPWRPLWSALGAFVVVAGLLLLWLYWPPRPNPVRPIHYSYNYEHEGRTCPGAFFSNDGQNWVEETPGDNGCLRTRFEFRRVPSGPEGVLIHDPGRDVFVMLPNEREGWAKIRQGPNGPWANLRWVRHPID
ncbi:MAG: toll/interleukin-1 receptor domain-containing protein [Bryobacterales bacterium]|nr:toll/interleukin-1 receptor domain-containing protein [Bryobacterales bacterium]